MADIFLVRFMKSLDNFLFNIFISFAIYSWVLSSAHEPLAILRKFMYSLFVPLSYPSAMLEGIETADL